LCAGIIFLTSIKSNKLKFEKIYIFYAGLAFLQLVYFSENYTIIRFAEVIYSSALPLMILMYGGQRINSRDSDILFKILTIVVWVNVFFAIFISNSYAGVDGQYLIFSNIGGSIPTAWMLLFWLIAFDYLSDHNKGATRYFILPAVVLCIIFLDSRSVLASLLIYIMMRQRKNYLLALGLIACSAALILFFGSLLGRISNFEFSDNSSQLRLNAVFVALNIMQDSYIMGSEVGRYFPRVDKNISEDLVTESGNAARLIGDYILPTEPHNSYLLYGVEYGIIGIIIVAYINLKSSFVRGKLEVNILIPLFVMFTTSSILKFDTKLFFLVVIFLSLCQVVKRDRNDIGITK
jgi:chromate transport protein ChrA